MYLSAQRLEGGGFVWGDPGQSQRDRWMGRDMGKKRGDEKRDRNRERE